jgi:large subunit ribosomal protein L22
VFNKTDSISGVAILNDSIIGPRKMRLIADLIRNESVDNAFSILSCNQKRCTDLFKKLLLSAVSNCEKKCESLKTDICDTKDLYISKICVDSAGMLKRTLPAPHGRAFRIRKRRSHVFLVVEPKNSIKNLDNKKNEKKAKKETEKKETKSENSESKKSTKK